MNSHQPPINKFFVFFHHILLIANDKLKTTKKLNIEMSFLKFNYQFRL